MLTTTTTNERRTNEQTTTDEVGSVKLRLMWANNQNIYFFELWIYRNAAFSRKLLSVRFKAKFFWRKFILVRKLSLNAHFWNKIFLVIEIFIQKEGQLDLMKVFKNGYFTKLETYLLELRRLSVFSFGKLFCVIC